MVVVFGASATFVRAESLSVFRRQSVPPHFVGVGTCGDRAGAATAVAAAAKTSSTMSPAYFTSRAGRNRTPREALGLL